MFRIVLVLAMVLVTAAAAMNVLTDDSAVRAAAETVGCPHGGCANATSTRIERTPFGETIEYSLPSGPVTVRCTRAAVFVGAYSCIKE